MEGVDTDVQHLKKQCRVVRAAGCATVPMLRQLLALTFSSLSACTILYIVVRKKHLT